MAYTGDQVDDLYVKFEKAARRQNANKASAVKLRAAENDLLRIAENVRDLLNEAVKGDKDLLVEVFGGNCRRFHKFRQTKDTVELSPMHATDQRWGHLSDSMDTIEEILKQIGTFKPFVFEKEVAPEITSYRGVKDCFTPGERIYMRPECDGAEADSFSIEPALPEGVELNRGSGEITGSLQPGNEVPKCTYTVTAKNAYGETKIDLTFSIAQPAPTGVVYEGVPSACYTDELVTWTADADGGVPQKWSISPALPAGLSFNPATGSISGIPKVVAEGTDYTVTAANASGAVSTILHFGVKPAPPVSLKYPDVKEEYPFGGVIYLCPDVALKISAAARRPGTAGWDRLRSRVLKPNLRWQILTASMASRPKLTFTVEPALPEGIVLAAKTGVISGSPSVPAEDTTYSVTCRNDGGEISTDLRFGIRLQAPSCLKYPEAEGKVLFVGQPVTLSPGVQGLVSEWSVEPALPPGLHLDPSLGIISGMPSEVVPEGSWSVTARNTEGEASATLTFAVQRAPPSSLEYPALLDDYPVLRAMALLPTVQGQVDAFTVEPPLPGGLEIDPASGVIQGTPSATNEVATYTVTARNDSGATTASLTFGVKVMPPESLAYPQIDDVYSIGEVVTMEPQVEGGATSWSVEPALPPGLQLDAATGKISGAPTDLATETSYVVTASNEAGGTSVVLTFSITAPKPEGLCYPDATSDYVVGLPVALDPQLTSGVCTTFSVEPALPEGLQLDPGTGSIRGSPAAESEMTTYTVTATNPTGSCSTELAFLIMKIEEEEEPSGVNQKFAALIEEITDIADLCEEPGKSANLGDWMIWMVHRAWLNDPTLTDFNFSNKWMPPPHMEPRIAPKLMKAIAHNTHITSLQLANSNMMKPQGYQLAESLKQNATLRILNIETNSLDSDGLTRIAVALKENETTRLEQMRFNNQKGLGEYFGRPLEAAYADLVETNMTIVKLGFTCNDAHWRMKIDRALLRNNDAARRRRKGTADVAEVEVAAKDKPLARMLLTGVPEKPVWEVFDLEDDRATVVRAFMAGNKRLPTKEQLQGFARNQGKSIPYSAVATVVKNFRTTLVNAVVKGNMTLYDIYGAEYIVCLSDWKEKNERWNLDAWQGGKTRYNFFSDKQPIIEISEDFAAWLHPPE